LIGVKEHVEIAIPLRAALNMNTKWQEYE